MSVLSRPCSLRDILIYQGLVDGEVRTSTVLLVSPSSVARDNKSEHCLVLLMYEGPRAVTSLCYLRTFVAIDQLL